MKKTLVYLFFGSTLLMQCQCEKEKTVIPPAEESGYVNLRFTHYADGVALMYDTLAYINAAGNEYLINELQYFISDIQFVDESGGVFSIDDYDDIHYVDSDIPSTQEWVVVDPLKTGSYSSLRFVFGITASKNLSYMYVNPPESNMFWPEFLGGGYHYLKLNGKWKDTTNTVTPFDFHLGIGQIYAGGVIVVDSITGFVQNYFSVELPLAGFVISKDERKTLEIRMDVGSRFETPHIWDHNAWGSYIMQNQSALQTVRENGMDVFSVTN